MAKKSLQKTSWLVVIPTTLVVAILIWVAIFSFWLSSTLFNQEFFVTSVTSALSSPQSRQIISKTVVNKMLAEYPLIKTLIGKTVDQSVFKFLDSTQVQFVYTKASEEVFYQMSAKDPREVALNFGTLLPEIAPLVTRINPQIGNTLAQVPEKMVIIPQGEIPSLYQVRMLALILGPLAAVLTVLLVALNLFLSKTLSDKLKMVGLGSILVAIISGVIYVLIPNLVASVFAQIDEPLVLTIASQMTGSFVMSLMSLIVRILVISALIGVGGLVTGFLIRKRI